VGLFTSARLSRTLDSRLDTLSSQFLQDRPGCLAIFFRVVPSHLGDVHSLLRAVSLALSGRYIRLDNETLEEPMQNESSVSGTWRALSSESASAIEKVGATVVAVHARRRIPASGVHWRPGIVVTADHALERDEEISVTLPDGRTTVGTLAGRDPSTDVAILKIESGNLPVPEVGNITTLKVGQWVLAAGRTSEGGARASLALVGVVGPAWRTWRGGVLDHTVRLDRNLHPNLSGGPTVDDQGRLLGINTSGFSRYTAVVIPASTVERVATELEKKGRIGRGYLGVGMQPVRLPRKFRELSKAGSETGIIIMRVEPESPAERAGLTLGDVLMALDETPVRDVDDVQACLTGEHIGKPVKASIIRGGALAEVVIVVGERPLAN
jgi:serine protease DegQ